MKKFIAALALLSFALSLVMWRGGRAGEEKANWEEKNYVIQTRASDEFRPSALSALPQRERAASRDPVFTEYKSEQSETFLWECLNKYAPNEVISAGILGYFWRESFFRSDSVSGWATVLAETGVDICTEVTAAIDKGLADASSREMFIYCIREQSGGYGLGQWFSMGYLETLYDFAREWGTSIGDAEMQCAFVVQSLQENTEPWELLLETEDAERAGELIAVYYDGTSVGVGYIGDMALHYYEKYHQEPQRAVAE